MMRNRVKWGGQLDGIESGLKLLRVTWFMKRKKNWTNMTRGGQCDAIQILRLVVVGYKRRTPLVCDRQTTIVWSSRQVLNYIPRAACQPASLHVCVCVDSPSSFNGHVPSVLWPWNGCERVSHPPFKQGARLAGWLAIHLGSYKLMRWWVEVVLGHEFLERGPLMINWTVGCLGNGSPRHMVSIVPSCYFSHKWNFQFSCGFLVSTV